jgi:hypothetical protein
VAHEHPSLQVAIRRQRLSDKAWEEVDRSIDDVRFEPGPEPLDEAPLRRRGENKAAGDFRDLLEAARKNTWLPWEDPGGLTRAQCVGLLTRAIERTKGLPVTSPGPMFHSLPF